MHVDYKVHPNVDNTNHISPDADSLRNNYCYVDYQNVANNQFNTNVHPYNSSLPYSKDFMFPYAAAAAIAAANPNYHIFNPYQNEPTRNNSSNELFQEYVIPSINYNTNAQYQLNAHSGCLMYAVSQPPPFHQIYNDFRNRNQLFPQYDRFNGRWTPRTNVKKSDGEQCKVCGANSSGFHFGVFTCEACKGFFRRYSRKQRRQVVDSCSVPCEINISNRNNCPACRFAKCKAVGMAIENIRYGKPPKSINCKIPRREYSCIRLNDSEHLQSIFDQCLNVYESISHADQIDHFLIRSTCLFNINLVRTEQVMNKLKILFNDEFQLKSVLAFNSPSKTKCLLSILLLLSNDDDNGDDQIYSDSDHLKQDQMNKLMELVELHICEQKGNMFKVLLLSDFLKLSSM